MQPALRAALYGLKPTVNTTDLRGSRAEGSKLSSVGGLARTPKDLADLTSVILPGTNFDPFLKGSWEGIKIAVVDPVIWHYPDSVCEVNPNFDKQSVCAGTSSSRCIITNQNTRDKKWNKLLKKLFL